VPFSADGYLERIGVPGPLAPTLGTLTRMLRAHMARIPWENLDVLLGRGIKLDLDSVYDKLVTARRGGYCFEHSILLAGALTHAGFSPVAHAARVIMLRPRHEAPRTHMLLTVPADGVTYMVDPGYGGYGPLVPMPLVADAIVRDGQGSPGSPGSNDAHRLVRRDGEWVLEGELEGAWRPFWTSPLTLEHPVDFVMANHYTSTHPQSAFATMLLMRAITPDGRRVSVANRDVTMARDGVFEKSQLADRAALRVLLQKEFAIDLPEVERLRVPAIPEWD
jgi:N-hydroxyarylamine O-acetyltransferase